MIKVKDLRVGNYVLMPSSNKFTEITPSDLYDIGLNLKNRIPIQLTEYWLLKLGFDKMSVNGFDYLLKISSANLQARQNAGHWYFQFNETYLGEIFTGVHQIQNFCIIFGKEITLQEE